LESFPEITILQQSKIDQKQALYYEELVRYNLAKVLKGEKKNYETDEEKIDSFKSILPSSLWELDETPPRIASLLFVYKYRIYSSKLIYDLISKWLVPGRELNISRYYGVDFEFKLEPNERYIMIEVLLDVETEGDLSIMKKTLPYLCKEIEIGVSSIDQGMRILEVKGMNFSDKVSQVQELIFSLINNKTRYFDHDLLREMQQFFVLSKDTFKQIRSHRYLVRLICSQYLFRKALSFSSDPTLSKRLFRLKLMRTTLLSVEGPQKVLGILVGVSYFRENESFGERQIANAVRAYIPSAEVVEDSFLCQKSGRTESSMLYLEFVKSDGISFASDEIQLLKNVLLEDLKGRVEQLMHPIFMPRNEEEIMRNILNLNKQLKSHDDIPQIIIQFDKQDEMYIVFGVILLRVVKNEEKSVRELCELCSFKYEFIPDRIKIVGRVKKGYSKEANVFYVRLDKRDFLRKDHSLDLYRARQAVLNELYRVFSDVRDFNGGMIAKENEIFTKLTKHMAQVSSSNEVLLENYFYSLTPVIIRSMVSVQLLETSFQIFLDLLEDEKPSNGGYLLKFSYQSHYIFCYIASKDSSFQSLVKERVSLLKLSRFQLITSLLQVEETFYMGLIYQSDRVDERKRFCDAIRNVLELWQKKEHSLAV
jgi:hypothetical protein